MIIFLIILVVGGILSFVSAEMLVSDTGVEYDSELIEQFLVSKWVHVTIDVKDFSNITISKEDSVAVQTTKDSQRWDIYRNTSQSVLSILSENEFQLKRKSEWGRSFSGNITKEGFEKLLKDDRVKKIYAEKEIHISLNESVSLINADDAWSSGYDGTGQTVCVIDTGINYSHSDLGGCLGGGCKVRGGYDYVNGDSNPMDDNGHGTHVTGIIVSQNTTYKGIAYGANVVALKAGDDEGYFSEQDIKDALSWCYNNRNTYNISIVSMSFGGPNGWGQCGEDFADAEINDLYNAGISLVAASGNDGNENEISYPACNYQTISVGMTYDENIYAVKA